MCACDAIVSVVVWWGCIVIVGGIVVRVCALAPAQPCLTPTKVAVRWGLPTEFFFAFEWKNVCEQNHAAIQVHGFLTLSMLCSFQSHRHCTKSFAQQSLAS